jgi:hypothetical protein
MSYTNQTANYGLPQYTADDKPTYLGDFNKAMLDIDTAIKASDTVAQASQTLAQNANNTSSEAMSTASTASTNATNAGIRADNAYALAENANQTASSAQSDATDALTIANSANQTATSANTTATNAQTTATNANNTATSADTKATQNASKIETLTPVVAYSNENPSSLAVNTVLQCSVDLNDYDYIEIIFINAVGQTRAIHSSGKCETSNTHSFACFAIGTQTNAAPWMRLREFTINTDGNLVAAVGHFLEFNGTGQGENNDAIIPIQILAYKLPN